MSSFLDKFIADTYNGILHSDIGLDETAISQIFDGDGNKSALSLGRENNGGKITGQLVSTSSTVEQNLSVGGDITADNISSSSINTDSIVINNSLQASNVNYPVSNNLTSLFALIYPVGSIYLTALDINPGSIFAGTTWVRTSEGRFLVGVGGDTDINGRYKNFTSGDNNGEYSHTLTIDKLPAHTHTGKSIVIAVGDDVPATNVKEFNTLIGVNVVEHQDAGHNNVNIGSTSNGKYDGELLIDPTGNGADHNNILPGFGVYVWQRTA